MIIVLLLALATLSWLLYVQMRREKSTSVFLENYVENQEKMKAVFEHLRVSLAQAVDRKDRLAVLR
jgi:hypothetical protein